MFGSSMIQVAKVVIGNVVDRHVRHTVKHSRQHLPRCSYIHVTATPDCVNDQPPSRLRPHEMQLESASAATPLPGDAAIELEGAAEAVSCEASVAGSETGGGKAAAIGLRGVVHNTRRPRANDAEEERCATRAARIELMSSSNASPSAISVSQRSDIPTAISAYRATPRRCRQTHRWPKKSVEDLEPK